MRLAELPVETTALAKFLVGAYIVSDAPAGRVAGRIVETEAYLPGDAAAHSFKGETARNRMLFARRGHAYVYFIYGMHFCLNVSAERRGIGAGVLLRAAEPVEGIELMSRRRGNVTVRDLCRGPGRLATALGVDRRHDGLDLTKRGPLWLAAPRVAPQRLESGPRIGLTKETTRELRFYEAGSRFVSARTTATPASARLDP